MHIAVIGAGAVGLATARELAVRGNRVTVIEASRPGAGTTGTTFAWVNSHGKEPQSYFELNLAGLRAHHELDAALGGGPRWFRPTGNLEWATAPEHAEALRTRAARLRERGYAVREPTPAQARELEPGARIPDGAGAVAFFPAEGHVLTGEFLARMLTDALACGAVLRCPARVAEVAPRPGGVRLLLEDGSAVQADAAVTAAGRWTEALTATAGHPVPMAGPEAPGSAAVGHLGYTAPAPVRLERVLTTGRLNVRPDGGGRLVLQGLDLDADADPAAAPAPRVAEALRERLAEVLVGGAFAEVAEVRVGRRALPADGLTVCGFADPDARLYTIATHSGITLAPALARWAAEEILDGTERPELAGFRPGRFRGGRPDVHLTQARLPGRQ
ncbi:NAD(P)/FAD-dependent oxidoreductase [Nocardiopsis composta]|uniref:Glycine/D-amino acid oxidase-like deaminating enzyme n=1 Tax=Nocardiopsis composta TaxID=157465 RepID=A0A7W8VCD2_9ACTN|nr:FAD-binding oxidoreductase [Nocardiopsis composta]MBB5430808.1 glycine/D-amino acid oxidase-like deaminating enzyme [Nocardiopsis composta]